MLLTWVMMLSSVNEGEQQRGEDILNPVDVYARMEGKIKAAYQGGSGFC